MQGPWPQHPGNLWVCRPPWEYWAPHHVTVEITMIGLGHIVRNASQSQKPGRMLSASPLKLACGWGDVPAAQAVALSYHNDFLQCCQ